MNKTKLKQAAALSIMCSLGTSAFAGEGSLWDYAANNYDTKAVDDIVTAVEYSLESAKDNVISEHEKQLLNEMKNKYDTDFGVGSFSFVINEISDFSNTPQGKSLGNEAIKRSLNPLKAIASHAVNKASKVQKQIKSLDMTLADKKQKYSNDVSDYYGR